MPTPQSPFRVTVAGVGRQAAQQATWARSFASSQPSWLVRAAAWAVVVALVLLALLVLIPLALIALAAFAVLALMEQIEKDIPKE